MKAATEAAIAQASREGAERDQAFCRAMGRSRLRNAEPPHLKTPTLPDDLAQRVAELDRQIVERGIAVSRTKLLSLGKKRFTELLEADRKARWLGRAVGQLTDLTRFDSVEESFWCADAFEVTAVPSRTSAEIADGQAKDREAVRQITGFEDLWKASGEPEIVRGVYVFHDKFASLVFGQSLLERLGDDGRLRSPFFAGGKGPKVALFHDWLEVLQGSHLSVILSQPFWDLMAQ